MRYEGRVYDGPWEGRNYASERPRFDVPMMPRSLDCRFTPASELVAPTTYEVKSYRWSAPLRAWVFCWDGYPSKYAYEDERLRYG